MGFLGSIINNAKEKGERETQSARIKILNAYDMRSASRTMHEAMKRSSSLAARSALISCFQSKIREESDMDGITVVNLRQHRFSSDMKFFVPRGFM